MKTRNAALIVLAILGLASAIRAAQQTVRYKYDAASRLVGVVYDDQAAVEYQYDASGNRLRRIGVGPSAPLADFNTNGLYDLWELIYFGNLTNAPVADVDDDGFSNEQESRSWTNPTNDVSVLQFRSVTNSSGAITLVWEADPRIVYRIWWTDILDAWSMTQSVTQSSGIWTDTAATNITRHYRVTVGP